MAFSWTWNLLALPSARSPTSNATTWELRILGVLVAVSGAKNGLQSGKVGEATYFRNEAGIFGEGIFFTILVLVNLYIHFHPLKLLRYISRKQLHSDMRRKLLKCVGFADARFPFRWSGRDGGQHPTAPFHGYHSLAYFPLAWNYLMQ